MGRCTNCLGKSGPKTDLVESCSRRIHAISFKIPVLNEAKSNNCHCLKTASSAIREIFFVMLKLAKLDGRL